MSLPITCASAGQNFAARAVVREAGRGDVVGQRVDPDIHHVFRVARNRHAPFERRAADREIGQTPLHEGDDLIQIFFRRDEVRMRGIVREQLVGVFGEPEEVAFLLDPFDRRAGRRQPRSVRAIGQLALVEIGLVPHRVPAGIFREIDVPVRGHPLPDRLRGARVSRLGRAHDVVGSGVQHVAHRLELGSDAIDKLLRRHPLARRRLLHFEAVLVHAGDEQRLAPVEAHESLDRIGRDALVSMADMRRAIGVRNCRGDVEAAHERRPKAKVFERR